jgi:type VI secretion system protein ImpA
MPVTLREDLLKPIAGDNPAGKSLRYDPIYDKIKEARREDDDAPQGEWQRERKTADWSVVIKLASDGIADKSKDLQLAVWLTEALLRKDGFNGLLRGLNLIRGMLDEFWEGLYPENEDGDLELRAAPLDWVGSYLEQPIKKSPITKSGLGFFKYKESRTVGYEEQANESSTKREAFDQAKREGKTTADEFDAAVKATPTAMYVAWMEDFDKLLETIDGLSETCESKFGEFNPSFSKLRTAVEEVRNVVRPIHNKRVEAEAPPPPPPLEAEAEPEPEPAYAAPSSTSAAPPPPPKPNPAGGIIPNTLDEVPVRLAAVAKYLRGNDAYDPAPYLMLRGYRWGETRRQGGSPHPSFIVAPTTESRQTIRRLASESLWGELIEAGEAAMAEPCGRAWMDLQRYMVKALEAWGCPAVANAIRAELRALISDIPEIANWTFDDDTPVANGETQAWLKEIAGPPQAAPPPPPAPEPEPVYEPPPRKAAEADPGAPPDPFEEAMAKVKKGRVEEAIEMLAQDIALQQSGRGRFHSKVNFCQLCLATKREHLAMPILEELVDTIDHHRLETWEPPDSIAHPLSLLYRCIDKAGGDPALKQKIYSRVARLDPMQAIHFAK